MMKGFSSCYFRMANLSNITETITKFDSIKDPLQEWCVVQQETFQSLPLLETNQEDLEKQKIQFETMLTEVLAHQQAVDALEDLSVEFLKHKEVCALYTIGVVLFMSSSSVFFFLLACSNVC